MQQTVGEFVAGDYRTAAVFERHGIDFCCGGNVTLDEACQEKGVEPTQLLREVTEATAQPLERGQNFATWELGFLADYIVNTHHTYVREESGTIAGYARKIAEVHGGRHPELLQIADIFDRIAAELKQHMHDEEETLFPAVRRLSAAGREGTGAAAEMDALRSSLRTLRHEHDQVGAAIHEIRALAHDYAVPDDACTTFTLTYRKLEEFEDDLHLHVHLENNILFPKAEKL
ncbi:iron-sulfur cluster repair di-iron protein [Geomonas sp. Red875]|uniref:Iron-sulfur cluster repair di-iron protein n=2 Tax=Geomesophilobacter sediminis TaxID=2798584 RepID=A0A8J7JA40_9BACT|nr:iron-sulfur cluster repair di-iron protein [Geomesophilobacter sediminis]